MQPTSSLALAEDKKPTLPISISSLPKPIWQHCMSFFETADIIQTQSVCKYVPSASKRNGRVFFQPYQMPMPFFEKGREVRVIDKVKGLYPAANKRKCEAQISFVTDSGTVFFCERPGVLGVLYSESTMTHKLPLNLPGLFNVLQVSSDENRVLLKSGEYYLLDLKRNVMVQIQVELTTEVQMSLDGTILAARNKDQTELFIYALVIDNDPTCPMKFKLLQSISRGEVVKEEKEPSVKEETGLNFSLSGNGARMAVWSSKNASPITIWCRETNESKMDGASPFKQQTSVLVEGTKRRVALNSTGSKILISNALNDQESKKEMEMLEVYDLNGVKYQRTRDLDFHANSRSRIYSICISQDGKFAAVKLGGRSLYPGARFHGYTLKVFGIKSGTQRSETPVSQNYRVSSHLSISPSFRFVLSPNYDQRGSVIELRSSSSPSLACVPR